MGPFRDARRQRAGRHDDLARLIGVEVAVPHHFKERDLNVRPIEHVLRHGELLLDAAWTIDEGGGRPLTKGTGAPLSDPTHPLRFPRNFNRLSAPDANACAGCHNSPFGIIGGGGDVVANVFVLGQRFDHLTFDPADEVPTGGATDERGYLSTLPEIANERATVGMFGSGYIEMLARQMTAELQAIRDQLKPGESASLTTKGVSFGTLHRLPDGDWNVSDVEGLPTPSTRGDTPSLIVRPFHQAGAVVSLREFTNNAFNHHHGIQSVERFGEDTDPDGDGFVNEMTVADVTAASLFQAAMAVPGRVIPRNWRVEAAVRLGEAAFAKVGCASCHRPALPLNEEGWIFSEPNPYNPQGNLQVGQRPTMSVDLNDPRLPSPRLSEDDGVVWVPAFTDLKLHDITSGPDDPNREPLDMHHPAGSAPFFEGNGKFLTKKLWGAANEPPYFHHGKYTTLRQAILAHAGEAEDSRKNFNALSTGKQDAVIEFLKTLQVLPPTTRSRVVDENYRPRRW